MLDLNGLVSAYPQYEDWITKFAFVLGDREIEMKEFLSLSVPEDLLKPLMYRLILGKQLSTKDKISDAEFSALPYSQTALRQLYPILVKLEAYTE